MSELDGRRVPLALHVGEGDLIDESRDAGSILPAASRARLGVELGPHDQRLGYWLHDAMPGEALSGQIMRLQSRLAPRRDVCHLYRMLRPGQVRGVPAFAPVLMAARDLADLMDAMVVKERMSAAIGLIVKTNEGSPSFPAKAREAAEAASGGGMAALAEGAMRPGAVNYLRPGEEASAFSPAVNSSFEPVAIVTLQAIAAGVGLTYDQITGDLRQANYSSLRAGKIEQRKLTADLQWNMLVPQALDRVAAAFVEAAGLAGLLPSRRHGWRRLYVMPAHEPIDPKKDLEADVLAVRAGRMSPQDFIGAWGRDWREVIEETAKFMAEIDARNLVFDIDGRQRTRTGQEIGQQSGQQGAAANDASQETA
jgi:lambda family phage portal protein